jgi:hypothetical protein
LVLEILNLKNWIWNFTGKSGEIMTWVSEGVSCGTKAIGIAVTGGKECYVDERAWGKLVRMLHMRARQERDARKGD